MNLLFTSAGRDSSGYGEASRNYICALSKVEGINLAARYVSFEHWKTDLGLEYKAILDSIPNSLSKIDTQIIHLTPENYGRHIIPGAKNIGYTVWETSKLPQNWVNMCNEMDEIWVPCEWNVRVFKDSGIKVPVKKIPHAFNPSSFSRTAAPSRRLAVPEDRFNFYSIFQWSARKNPEGLLQAYFSEFGADEPVCLTLKTFLHNNSLVDKENIKKLIAQVKKKMWLDSTPPIILINETLSRDEILDLHSLCDAFVLPHRAEGWGIPHFEAMAMDNICISTGFSGNLEFMNDYNSHLANYFLTPCYGMDRPTYNGKMQWAEPSIDDLRMLMRRAYEQKNSSSFIERPSKVLEKFSWEVIGQLMAKELGL